VLRQVDLAVVHDDGLRGHRREQRLPVRIGEPGRVDHDVAGQAVVGRADIGLPGRGLGQRPDRLEQHRCRVHRLRRHGGQAQAGDAPVVKVHPGGQLGLHPAQRHRVHREHVQPGGVQQQVLTRPHRPQPPVGCRRAAGDLPLCLRPAERGRALGDLPQQRAGAGRLRDRDCPVAVLGVQPGGDLGQYQVPGGLAGLGVLGQYPPGHLQPARVGPRERLLAAPPPVIGQPGRAALLEVLHPPAQRGNADADLGGLGGIPGQQRGAGRVLRARLAVCRQLCASAPESRPHLLDMGDAFPQLGHLCLAQPG
jgi:hypothetical protein